MPLHLKNSCLLCMSSDKERTGSMMPPQKGHTCLQALSSLIRLTYKCSTAAVRGVLAGRASPQASRTFIV